MAVTGQKVFEKAIKLMDEVNETGAIIESKVQDYKAKAPAIIETLQYELSDAGTTFTEYTDLTHNLTISDMKALTVLPYGLAAELMISADDDQSIAAYLNSRYEELKRKYPPAVKITTIKNVYGRR